MGIVKAIARDITKGIINFTEDTIPWGIVANLDTIIIADYINDNQDLIPFGIIAISWDFVISWDYKDSNQDSFL